MAVLSLGAVLLLAGAALVATTHDPQPPTPSAQREDPLASLDAITDRFTAVEVPVGPSPSQAMEAAGLAEFQVAVDNATARLAAATAAVGSLGEGVPAGNMVLAGAVPRDWPVPAPAGGLSSVQGTAFEYVPAAGVASQPSQIGAPETGKGEVDAALSEAAAALAQAKALWQSPEAQALLATLDGTPVGTPGVLRDPFGAQGAVEPDEESAVLAQSHADEVLGTVGTGYNQLGVGLDRMIAIQQGLAADVAAAMAAADAFEAQAAAGADAELEARLRSLDAAALAYSDAVRLAATAYEQAVLDARDGALAALESAVAAHEARIDAAVAEAEREVKRAVAAVQAQTDAGIRDIEAHEAVATAYFAQRAAAGADVSSLAQLHAAAVLKAKADLDAQASQAQRSAAERLAALQAEAESTKALLEAEAALARAAIEDQAAAALAWADAREATLLLGVDEALKEASAAQVSLHGQAQAAIVALAQAHRAQVVAQANGIVEDAQDHATTTLDAVQRVQGATLDGVGVDLDTIGKVAEDYGAVPAGERKQRADEWTRVHGLLAGALDGVVVAGEDVADKAARLLAAAEAAHEAFAQL